MQDDTQEATSRREGQMVTFARAFLQGTQALRVTDSGTLRRFEDALAVELPSASFSWRTPSDPVVDSDVFGVLIGVLLSPNEGRILRNALLDMFDIVNSWRALPSGYARLIKRTATSSGHRNYCCCWLQVIVREENQDCGFLMQAGKWMNFLSDISKGCARGVHGRLPSMA